MRPVKPTDLRIVSSPRSLDLLAFVRDGLLDSRARRRRTCRLIPSTVPAALTVAIFQRCQ
jgi:hypothetical protein